MQISSRNTAADGGPCGGGSPWRDEIFPQYYAPNLAHEPSKYAFDTHLPWTGVQLVRYVTVYGRVSGLRVYVFD